jgi:hypothetical protein
MHRLSRTYVIRLDPEEVSTEDPILFDQRGDRFIRLNYEYEVIKENEFWARTLPSDRPKRHKLHPTNNDRQLTYSELMAEKFFTDDIKWQLVWKPKNAKRIAHKRKRDDEYYFDPGDIDTEPRPRKKNKE